MQSRMIFVISVIWLACLIVGNILIDLGQIAMLWALNILGVGLTLLTVIVYEGRRK